jgi:transposase
VTIPIPSGTRVWLATGHTDMRKGFDGLALLVQETLQRNPHNGHLFVFRGRRGSLIKVLWHDGQGMCLSPSALNADASCGHRPLRATARIARWRSRRRNWDICWKASTGGCRITHGVRKRRADCGIVNHCAIEGSQARHLVIPSR